MDDNQSEQRSNVTVPVDLRPGDVIPTPFGEARVLSRKLGIAVVQMLDDGGIAYCICPMEISKGESTT